MSRLTSDIRDLCRKAPVAIYRRTLGKRRYKWPFYNIESYFKNREAVRLYSQARPLLEPRPVEQKIVEDLRREGISLVEFDELLPAEMFERARKWAERLVEDKGVKERIEQVQAGHLSSRKFYLVRPLGDLPVFDPSDAVMEISLSEPVLRIVSSYFGMLPRLNAADLWYNVPLSGPAVSSQLWHRDPEDRKLLKMFLYLRDVDANTGPFGYIPGSHNGGPYAHIYRQMVADGVYPGDEVVEKLFPIEIRREYPGKAGTLIFCDTTGLHRGGRALAKGRLLFNAIYTSSASPVYPDRYRLRKSSVRRKSSTREFEPIVRFATDQVRAP